METFPETTREEFHLNRNTTEFTELAAQVATSTSKVLRELLDGIVTEVSHEDLESIEVNEYLKNRSDTYSVKIGVKLGDSDFLALALNDRFISTCTHFFIGGTGKSPERIIDKMSLSEQAFLEQFSSRVKNNLDATLKSFGLNDASVNFIVDKTVALKKQDTIFLNTVSFTIEDDDAEITLIASQNAINGIQERHNTEPSEAFQKKIMEQIHHGVSVVALTGQISKRELEGLQVGSKISYRGSQAPTTVDVQLTDTGMVVAEGDISIDEDTHEESITVINRTTEY